MRGLTIIIHKNEKGIILTSCRKQFQKFNIFWMGLTHYTRFINSQTKTLLGEVINFD
ncbi:hypothetical protein MNV_1380015 [Candidatus Methanoperedens nitroreducens]|uniref:Uncharacterized protein n=1 Tax=Candidatus Methanoperedens nitratireducens TaxID=1392998 RepID=A0A284VKP0_9EURY|nr:hypothetical protein MNV_1380015 [Candidatus Methanoperedens nitroreducens]